MIAYWLGVAAALALTVVYLRWEWKVSRADRERRQQQLRQVGR